MSIKLHRCTSCNRLFFILPKTCPRCQNEDFEEISSEDATPEELYTTACDLDEVGCYTLAAALYEEGAEIGSAECANNLGGLYEYGLGLPQNPQNALKWYKHAADGGLAIGVKNVGHCLLNGIGVSEDTDAAIRYFETACEQGCAEAYGELGYIHELRGEKDEARECFENGADAEDAGCILRLAMMADAEVTDGDYTEVLDMYRRAHDAGSCVAMFMYASIKLVYGSEEEREQSTELVAQMLKRGCEDELLQAQENIGMLHIPDSDIRRYNLVLAGTRAGGKRSTLLLGCMEVSNFKGIHNNPIRAIQLMDSVAELFPVAYGLIAEVYMSEMPGVHDIKQAKRYYKKSIEHGELAAYSAYAEVILDSNSKPEEIQEAVELLKKGVELGDAACKSMLGVRYIETGENVADGVRMVQEAADAGDMLSLERLAAYIHDDTFPTILRHDDARAFDMLMKAYNEGCSAASYTIGRFYEEGGDTWTADLKTAADWYKKAAISGDERAFLRLGEMYLYGIYFKKNLNRARMWVQKAVDNGANGAEEVMSVLNEELAQAS